jgi:hypothetical protein
MALRSIRHIVQPVVPRTVNRRRQNFDHHESATQPLSLRFQVAARFLGTDLKLKDAAPVRNDHQGMGEKLLSL